MPGGRHQEGCAGHEHGRLSPNLLVQTVIPQFHKLLKIQQLLQGRASSRHEEGLLQD